LAKETGVPGENNRPAASEGMCVVLHVTCYLLDTRMFITISLFGTLLQSVLYYYKYFLPTSFCISLFVLLSFFFLVIVLSVLFRFTDSDYSFDIFKLFALVVWKTARILRYTQRACCLCSTQCDISDGELNNAEMDNYEAFGLISGSS
jgi:hypothetical protein